MILKCQQGINTDLKKLHCSINIKCFICEIYSRGKIRKLITKSKYNSKTYQSVI